MRLGHVLAGFARLLGYDCRLSDSNELEVYCEGTCGLIFDMNVGYTSRGLVSWHTLLEMTDLAAAGVVVDGWMRFKGLDPFEETDRPAWLVRNNQ